MTKPKSEVSPERHEQTLLRQRLRRRNGYRGPNEVPRHLRLTSKDKRRKIAQQFRRRLNSPRHIEWQLGTEDFWKIYNQRLQDQGGKCAICHRSEPGGRGKRWHMDHNHSTGEIRGLLCCGCNLKLAWVEKNLGGIVRYLRRWKSS